MNNEKKDANDMFQIIQLGVLYFIKFKSSPKHKTIFNYIILYFIALMMTNLKFLKNL